MRKQLLCLILVAFAAAAPSGFAQERFRKAPPVPERLAELNLPKIDSIRLSNGLTVAVIYLKNLPFICAEMTIQAGERDCPENHAGLAGFTAEMLTRGTTLLSASDIEERVDGIGGALSASATLDYSRLSFLFLDENLDQALETLSQLVLQPDFSDKEIASLKFSRRYDMLRDVRNPENIGRQQLLRLLFKDHPYGRAVFNEDAFKDLSRKDVLGFYQRFYHPNNATVVLAGNLNLTAASRKVSRYFNTWQEKEVARPISPPPETNRDERVCLVDLPRSKDATVFVGNLASPVDDPDVFPSLVLNQVLGGTPNSRLFMNLRESKEYANFAFSEVEFFRSAGSYEVRARVIPSACFPAVQEILKEIDRLGREKVTTFELEQAKSYLIGNFPLQIGRLETLTQRVSQIMTFSLGDAYWNKFYDSIMLVDAERVLEVGKKFLLPKPIVVIVGDKAALAEYLRDFPRVEVYDTKGELLYTMLKGVEE
jgi:zinc protease